jgi:hypothetical protein
MKVEIDSENLLTLQILAAMLQTDVTTVTNDCIGWHLTLPLGNRGVSFLAEQIAGWPFDSEQDAICAAEKFNEVAVSANLEDKTEFLVANPRGAPRTRKRRHGHYKPVQGGDRETFVSRRSFGYR